jgi:hypothetical protein
MSFLLTMISPIGVGIRDPSRAGRRVVVRHTIVVIGRRARAAATMATVSRAT